MYGIFTYSWVNFRANVGKYTIHGAYGIRKQMNQKKTARKSTNSTFFSCRLGQRAVVSSHGPLGQPSFTRIWSAELGSQTRNGYGSIPINTILMG